VIIKALAGPLASALYTKQIFREHVAAAFRHKCASIRGIIGYKVTPLVPFGTALEAFSASGE
jgi:hypothetical protein